MTTKALCWRVVTTRGDQILGTSHDADLVVTASGYTGTYSAATGITGSNLASKADLSVDNAEVQGALFSTAVTAADIEAGLYDGAQVVLFETDWTNPSAVTVLKRGLLGNLTRTYEQGYTAEILGLAQQLAQPILELISVTCRADFGDTRCKVDLAPLTVSGTVTSVAAQDTFTDSSLTQPAVTVSYTDPLPEVIPSVPWQIQAVPPAGGDYVANVGVAFADGTPLTSVGGTPDQGQYSVTSGGLYTFSSFDAGRGVRLSYTYSYGYFDLGLVTWLTGANAGYTMQVLSFGSGVVKLFLPMVGAIAVGDTYNIRPGCRKDKGTCKGRWNNLVNMRAEAETPGNDALARVLT